jgi:hypothetical protein
MKTMAIMVVCLFAFTTIAWSAPIAETAAINDELHNIVDAQTLATQQGTVNNKQNLKQRVIEFIDEVDILTIFRSNPPEVLAEKKATSSTPTVLPKPELSFLFKRIVSAIFMVFLFFSPLIKGQAQHIDVLDVKNIDASVYSKLPEDLNRPIPDLVRAITRDSYKSQVKNGYYSIGEASTRNEAEDKANLLQKCIPSIEVMVRKEGNKKHVLYIKYLDNKSNIAWQVDYLSKHLGFSKENIIANIWKESVFDETAFSTAGAGGYLQVMAIAFREIQNRVNDIEKNENNIKKYKDAIQRDQDKLADASPAEKKRLQEAIKTNELSLEDLGDEIKEIDILYRYLYAVAPKDVRNKLKSYKDASKTILKDSYFKDPIDVPASFRNDINVQEKLSRYILWSMHIGDLNIPAGVTIKALYMNDIEEMIKQRQIPEDTEPEMAADLMYNMGPGNFALLMKGRSSFADMIGAGLSQESRNYACKFLVMKLKLDPGYKIIANNKDMDQKVKRYLITQVMFCDNSEVRLAQLMRKRDLSKSDSSERSMIEKSLREAKKERMDRTIRFNSKGQWLSPKGNGRRNIDWGKYSNEDVKQFFIDYLANNQDAAKLHGYMKKALYALEWNDRIAKGDYRDFPAEGEMSIKKEGNRLWLLLGVGATVIMLAYAFNRKNGSATSDAKVDKKGLGKQASVMRPGRIPAGDAKFGVTASNVPDKERQGEEPYTGVFNIKNDVIRVGSRIEWDLTSPDSPPRYLNNRSDSRDASLERAHLAAA